MPSRLSELGGDIRTLRERKGWKLHQLADAVNLSDSMISLIETGQREPSWYTLSRIAAALGYRIHIRLVKNW